MWIALVAEIALQDGQVLLGFPARLASVADSLHGRARTLADGFQGVLPRVYVGLTSGRSVSLIGRMVLREPFKEAELQPRRGGVIVDGCDPILDLGNGIPKAFDFPVMGLTLFQDIRDSRFPR